MTYSTLPSVAEIRRRIREELPAKAFETVPTKALLFIPMCGIVAGAIWLAHQYDLRWYELAALSLILGQVYATGAFLAHDALHGSIVRSRRLADLLGYLGFGPMLVSPHLWRIWHVAAHHGNTNTARDPDAIANLDEYYASPIARIWTRLIPCSRQPLAGVAFFGYWFTLHGQHILWLHKHYSRWQFEKYGFRQGRAIADTIAYVAFWSAVWYLVGWYNAIFVIIIPMMICNAIVMAFIATEHTCMPRSNEKENHPLKNSVSARVPSVVDLLNLNFSHHVEHHLFPAMSYEHTPLVRDWLRRNMSEHYMEPTMSKCLSVLFGSPRIYRDNEHLCYPDDVEETQVSTRKLRARLRGEREAA